MGWKASWVRRGARGGGRLWGDRRLPTGGDRHDNDYDFDDDDAMNDENEVLSSSRVAA